MFEHAEQASSSGAFEGGGGGGGGQQACLIKEGGATGFLWNFHRYRLSNIYIHGGTLKCGHLWDLKKVS